MHLMLYISTLSELSITAQLTKAFAMDVVGVVINVTELLFLAVINVYLPNKNPLQYKENKTIITIEQS